MHPGASAGKHRELIRNDFAVSRNDPQKRGSTRAPSAAKAGSYGFHLIPLLNTPWRRAIPATSPPRHPAIRCFTGTGRTESRISVCRKASYSSDSRIESGWMSIRAPVSFAARRAFWPSLPIASESW